jgi:hypothetical protein
MCVIGRSGHPSEVFAGIYYQVVLEAITKSVLEMANMEAGVEKRDRMYVAMPISVVGV